MRKLIKIENDYSERDKLMRLELTTLLEKTMNIDLIETFKIINGISEYDGHFLIFLLEQEIYCQGRLQKLSLLIKWIFFIYREIYIRNTLSNKIINSSSLKN